MVRDCQIKLSVKATIVDMGHRDCRESRRYLHGKKGGEKREPELADVSFFHVVDHLFALKFVLAAGGAGGSQAR